MSDAKVSHEPIVVGVFHLNQIGDLVFSLPALGALRRRFPEARLISVVRENVAPLLEGVELIDDVITHQGSGSFLSTVDELRAAKFDLAVCLSESPRSRLLAWLSGAQARIGLGGGPLASLLTERVPKEGFPSTGNNLRVVRRLGCPAVTKSYVGLLKASDEDLHAAAGLLEMRSRQTPGDPLVVIAPGASQGRQEKEWPTERFAAVAEAVVQLGGVPTLVGADVRPELSSEGVVDLGGRTSLRELIGILGLADLFVGNDSGVLHLAAALGTPCVALFGPTDPVQTGPHGEGHVVLSASEDGPASIDQISTERVLETVVGRIRALLG